MKRLTSNKTFILFILFLSLIISNCGSNRDYNDDSNIKSRKGEIKDGIYDASVTTSSGTYNVQIRVRSGKVVYVDWPNGGQMSLTGATIVNKHAVGMNSKGYKIEIYIH